MTKDETIKLATLIQQVKDVKDDTASINKHLSTLNGAVSETVVKLAKAEEIAKQACEKSNDNRGYIDKLVIAILASSASAVIALIIAIVKG
jgi:hypothetical protein